MSTERESKIDSRARQRYTRSPVLHGFALGGLCAAGINLAFVSVAVFHPWLLDYGLLLFGLTVAFTFAPSLLRNWRYHRTQVLWAEAARLREQNDQTARDLLRHQDQRHYDKE